MDPLAQLLPFLSGCGERSTGSVWLEKLPNTNGLNTKRERSDRPEETGWDKDRRVFGFLEKIQDPPTHTLKGNVANATYDWCNAHKVNSEKQTTDKRHHENVL